MTFFDITSSICPPTFTGCAAPVFVPGAIAATSAASRITNPAEAPRAPEGATNTATGVRLASMRSTICRIAPSSPPGVFMRITTSGAPFGVGAVDRLHDVPGAHGVDDAVEIDDGDLGAGRARREDGHGRDQRGRQLAGHDALNCRFRTTGCQRRRGSLIRSMQGGNHTMFGTLGGPELFLIFVVALIIFGPRKLPEIGKSLGKMMAEFRKASNEFRSTIESEVEAEKIRDAMRIEPPRLWRPSSRSAATRHGRWRRRYRYPARGRGIS